MKHTLITNKKQKIMKQVSVEISIRLNIKKEYWRTPRGVLAYVSAHERTLNSPPLDVVVERKKIGRKKRRKIREKKN